MERGGINRRVVFDLHNLLDALKIIQAMAM